MIFERSGLKGKCPECGGLVFRDPIKGEDDIVGYKITCGNCGKEFSEWPPPPKEE